MVKLMNRSPARSGCGGAGEDAPEWAWVAVPLGAAPVEPAEFVAQAAIAIVVATAPAVRASVRTRSARFVMTSSYLGVFVDIAPTS
jgi:hypothetical protein